MLKGAKIIDKSSSPRRKNMTKKLLGGMCSAFAAVLLAGSAFAQDDRVMAAAGDKYVISAKAGGVNYTEGKVAVARVNGRSGLLVKGDDLDVGEQVSTDAAGKAEILLNPGSYLRLGGNSSFEFVTTSLDDLKIKLRLGSAIFEVIVDNDFRVSVMMPKSEIDLTNSGVYRIDVMPDGTSKVSVWKGKVEIGEEDETRVKSGKSAVLGDSSTTVAKFDRDEKDALELWSKDRAKELTKINSRLQRNTLRDSLLYSFNRRGWNVYDSFGVWVLDRFTGQWCFLPFGYGWSSPYGFGYGFDMWRCRMPYIVYSNPNPGYPGPTAGTPNPRVDGPAPPTSERRKPRAGVPPYRKMERIDGDGGVVTRPRREDGPIFTSPFPRRPSSSPAPTSGSVPLPRPSSPVDRKGRPE